MDDIFKIEPLVRWLETKRATDEYNFADRKSCVLAQYYEHLGTDADVGGWTVTIDTKWHTMSEEFSDIAAEEPHTFGAALERARALL